ncbi:MAG: flagellar motor stator protein MotA [Sphingomonadaceae bacterium]|nr:flagellar motor stator protein MotA [Sphingomonadaceae bacterium]
MLVGIGLVILLVMVFGGFALTGGNVMVILEAIPHELIVIGGAALGSLVIGNSMPGLKALARGVIKAAKGPTYHREDYLQAIFLTAKLMKILRTEGPVALESHVEEPAQSELFKAYPKLLADHFFVALVTDTLRLVLISSGNLNLRAVEEVVDNAIRNHHRQALRPAQLLQSLGDAFPALGIVAAVLGVVKTMASIDKPPAILGGMIGSALVGTFMGVLIAYGIVSPLAHRLKHVIEEDAELYRAVKQIILASLAKHPQPLVIEAARTGISAANQPSFAEVFQGLQAR